MNCPLALLASLLSFAATASTQTSFEEVTPAANIYFATPESDDFWVNAVAPADADGDGDLDLAVLGFYVVYNESVEHFRTFFDAVRARRAVVEDAAFGYRAAAPALLTNESYFKAKPVGWDPDRMELKGS